MYILLILYFKGAAEVISVGYCMKSRHCAIFRYQRKIPRAELEVILEVSKNSTMTRLRSITGLYYSINKMYYVIRLST